jgi:hypothetical protein
MSPSRSQVTFPHAPAFLLPNRRPVPTSHPSLRFQPLTLSTTLTVKAVPGGAPI